LRLLETFVKPIKKRLNSWQLGTPALVFQLMSGALDSSLHLDEDLELGRRKTHEAGLADPVGDSLLVAHRDQALVA